MTELKPPMEEFVAPSFKSDGFNCPQCGAFAHQIWGAGYFHCREYQQVSGVSVSRCIKCGRDAIWVHQKLIWPAQYMSPKGHKDMPMELVSDYEEARSVVGLSPRGAAALLRLVIEKLMPILKAEGKDLNSQIGYLVSKGLPETVQKALDSVRVIGNHAVHPGQIDLSDDKDTAKKLFDLVNAIIELTISRERLVQEMYSIIPIDAKEAIEKRDS